MLAIIIAATAALVTRLGATDVKTRQLVATQRALAIARQAVIDYAVVRPDLVPGQPVALPRPDIDESLGLAEGVAHAASCGASGETVIGRVPWRTLGVAPPRDSSSACIWYVVSGGWKEAGPTTSSLINPDSNGQLQVWGVDSATIIEGAIPSDRPIALLLAPMDPVSGQTRVAPGSRQCSAGFAAADYLDLDGASGIDNATLAGVADAIDVLAVASERHDDHNDRIVSVKRSDIARAVMARPDFDVRMRGLTRVIAECVADYGNQNSGGAVDRRLPWPAPPGLADYRPENAYDDVDNGVLSGRLPDVVDDSNAQTGNPVFALLSACDSTSVVDWTVTNQALWRHWKDHFYYVVAESHVPDATVPSTCSNCLTVNGAGQYVAVVLFANARLDTLAQVRDAPPTDPDTRDDVNNYLEDRNAAGFPYTGGGLDLLSQAGTATFTDVLFCIDASLNVSGC
ncbi:MAG: hypothetical protein ACE5F8_07420 [Woeseiaceae bacterium]